MRETELKTIYGGKISLSVSFFNAISRYIVTIKGLGETVGSSIKRVLKKNYC